MANSKSHAWPIIIVIIIVLVIIGCLLPDDESSSSSASSTHYCEMCGREGAYYRTAPSYTKSGYTFESGYYCNNCYQKLKNFYN